MDEKIDKLSELLHRESIIHDGRVRNARSAEIAIAIVKFLKEG